MDPASPVIGPAQRDIDLAALASQQHGVVGIDQMRQIGLSPAAIARRVRSGRLHPLHRGIYAVGHTALGPHATLTAAVLAVGPRAVLSHATAARLWDLPVPPEFGENVHVTVAATRRRHRCGVQVHAVAVLHPDEIGRRHRLPVTSPPRTILDLAASLATRDLRRLLEESLVARIATVAAVDDAVQRRPKVAGAPALRGILAQHADPAITRSEAERRLIELIEAAGLPRPRGNARLGDYEVDLLWPRERLVAEADGFAFHGSRAAFERDRIRDADLQAAGDRVVRFTWRQIADEPERLLVRLARLLDG